MGLRGKVQGLQDAFDRHSINIAETLPQLVTHIKSAAQVFSGVPLLFMVCLFSNPSCQMCSASLVVKDQRRRHWSSSAHGAVYSPSSLHHLLSPAKGVYEVGHHES